MAETHNVIQFLSTHQKGRTDQKGSQVRFIGLLLWVRRRTFFRPDVLFRGMATASPLAGGLSLRLARLRIRLRMRCHIRCRVGLQDDGETFNITREGRARRATDCGLAFKKCLRQFKAKTEMFQTPKALDLSTWRPLVICLRTLCTLKANHPPKEKTRISSMMFQDIGFGGLAHQKHQNAFAIVFGSGERLVPGPIDCLFHLLSRCLRSAPEPSRTAPLRWHSHHGEQTRRKATGGRRGSRNGLVFGT